MAWNGAGVYTLLYSFVQDAANGIKILASRQDAMWQDLATNGFGNTITRDGQGSASANQPMNGYVHTGVGNATALNQYASASQVQSGSLGFAVGAGSGDAVTATFSPALTLTNGMLVTLKMPGANTVTAPTFAPDGGTARTIKRLGGAALAANEYASGQMVTLCWDNSNTCWQMIAVNPNNLTAATATSLAIGGIAIAGNALAVNGTAFFNSAVTHATTSLFTGVATFTAAPVFSNQSGTRSALSLGNIATVTYTSSASGPSGTPADGDLWFQHA